VEVSELAITNRSEDGTGITAIEAAEQAVRILHQNPLPSGRTVAVSSIRRYPAPPSPADNCFHVAINLSNIPLAKWELPQ